MTQKNRHLHIMAQLYQAVSSQLRHVSTCSQYGKLRPTNSWDRFVSLGHPSKFQRVSHLGSVTARHWSSGCRPNFVALSRGRHLHSAGRPHVRHRPTFQFYIYYSRNGAI